MRGHLSEGRAWLEEFLAREPAGAGQESGAAAVRARALRGAGELAWQQGDLARATTLAEESLALRRELGDKQGIAFALHNLGIVAHQQGDYRGRRPCMRRAWPCSGSWGTQGIALAQQPGDVAEAQGDYARATALYEESLALFRERGDTWGIATSLNNRGRVAQTQGDYARATALLRRAWPFRDLGDKQGIAESLQSGKSCPDQGDSVRATALIQQSVALFRDLGDKLSIASTLEGLARVATTPGSTPGVQDARRDSGRGGRAARSPWDAPVAKRTGRRRAHRGRPTRRSGRHGLRGSLGGGPGPHAGAGSSTGPGQGAAVRGVRAPPGPYDTYEPRLEQDPRCVP